MSMDVNDLRRKVLAAREFAEPLGDVVITLRVPTEHEVEVQSLRAGGVDGLHQMQASMSELRRRLLEGAVVGWSGVMLSHFLPGHEPDEPQDYLPELVALLLDAQPDWAVRLDFALVSKLAARRAPQQEAEKN